nr:membrane-spanning 4-domains subfamily A member 8-like [Zootoca vivipara]
MNITSAAMASVGIILYLVGLYVTPFDYSSSDYGYYWTKAASIVLVAVLLLFSILEFCIAVSSVYFGYQLTCCSNDQVNK